MRSNPELSLLALMAVCVLILTSRQIEAQEEELRGEALINKVCEKTPSKDVCAETLKKDPRSQTGGLKEMALISVQAAKDNATDIISHLKVLVVDDSLSPDVQQGMSDCLDVLGDAQEQLNTATAAMLVKIGEDAEKWLQAAVDAVSTCEGYLHGDDHLLLHKEDNFRLMCNISLSICKALDNNQV
ncbi:pectinesterase inhibitor-like [Neltuma alba]|uniref:pectinesterase inhibitor-like n=1 Tax=Neltuma alba TaxID=207710 RepID=UPI0010A53CCE|nr:pectinesterase inhibitor-like [Prosopis alba]XP_028786016.1 pectinesterase inhibitor-like [Prosopis alba]